MASLEDYRNQQLIKLARLKELGLTAYRHRADVSHSLSQVLSDQPQGRLNLAGRWLASRVHGQLIFADLADDGPDCLQLIIKADQIKADPVEGCLGFDQIDLLTRGDFVGAAGQLGRSQAGQLSLMVDRLQLLTKVLRPLPTKLTDVASRRRRRYLDLAVNAEVRDRFRRRSRFWQASRDFLNGHGFCEINTPVLELTTGGAEAEPFVTKMAGLDDQQFYLRISHELALKRLLGGGFSKVYDIGPRFRNEGLTEEHLPEHVALEWYWAYHDWQAGRRFLEDMIRSVLMASFETLSFSWQDQTIDFSEATWPTVDYCQLLADNYNGLDVLKADWSTLADHLAKNKLTVETEGDRIGAIDKLWKNVRVNLAGPFWLVNPPLILSPLAKADPSRPETAERFWLVGAGSELAMGFSELNDPQLQLASFLQQQQFLLAGRTEAQMLDLDFVEMLEYGMPPAVGVGYSERLFWLLEGVPARDGVPFGPFKVDYDASSRSVYSHLFAAGGPLAGL